MSRPDVVTHSIDGMQESVAGEELVMFEDKRIMIVRDNIQAFKHVLALEFVCTVGEVKTYERTDGWMMNDRMN